MACIFGIVSLTTPNPGCLDFLLPSVIFFLVWFLVIYSMLVFLCSRQPQSFVEQGKGHKYTKHLTWHSLSPMSLMASFLVRVGVSYEGQHKDRTYQWMFYYIICALWHFMIYKFYTETTSFSTQDNHLKRSGQENESDASEGQFWA